MLKPFISAVRLAMTCAYLGSSLFMTWFVSWATAGISASLLPGSCTSAGAPAPIRNAIFLRPCAMSGRKPAMY